MKHVLITLLFLLFILDCFNQEIIFLENKLQELSLNPYENSDSILYYSETILKLDSLNESAIDGYQFALYFNGMYPQYLNFLNRLIKLDSTNINFYIDRGLFKILVLNDTSGIYDLRCALETRNCDPELLFNIGNTLYTQANRKHDSLFKFEWYDIAAYSDSTKRILEREKKLYEFEACLFYEKTYKTDPASFDAIKWPLIILYKRLGENAKADSMELLEYKMPSDSLFYPISPLQFYFPQYSFLDTINIHNANSQDTSFYEDRVLRASEDNSNFSIYLRGFKEPLVYGRKDSTEIYRFLWMRSFDEPFVIRMEKTKEEQYVIVKKKNGISGGQLGEIVMNDTIPLSESQWADFVDVLNESDFWETPSIEKTEQLINDGAYWIVEGRLHDKYHVVYRHSPSRYRDPKFRQLGLYMLELCNLDLTDSEIY